MNEVKEVFVTYLSDKIPELTYVDGKSDWIDLAIAEDVELHKDEFKLISLGVSIRIPDGYEMIIAPRSSTFMKYGVIQANSLGIIDESYGKTSSDDVLRFPAYATRDVKLEAGTRICQFRLQEHQPKLKFTAVEKSSGVARGGFGSTGN